MTRTIRTLLRGLAMLGALALLAALLPSDPTASSPYLSALATLGVLDAQASATCSNRACASFGVQCVHNKGTNCRRIDICSETAC